MKVQHDSDKEGKDLYLDLHLFVKASWLISLRNDKMFHSYSRSL
jgi:hypothetical protein